ncbi:hypothetical protein [Sphingomonas sp. 2SG]|uniref:hypothetical protein n=1 Tax=Sphingomonas sp. 2SG TaxID=2502201 RepID=UPI0010F55B08|nr:hypothetical protein [Sphingomonas sp. 2SG]
MFQKFAEREVHAFLQAARAAIDPHRNILTTSTPYVIGGSIGPVTREFIAAGAMTSHDEADADYIHLEFEPGGEAGGPVNVKVGMIRFGIVHVRESGRFWLGQDGRLSLVASAGPKAATMSFDPDGMEPRPGLPVGQIAIGYDRAAARLRELADMALASSDFGSVHALGAAA